MNKLSKNEEIARLKDALMEKVKSENDFRYNNLSSDEIMKIIIESSNKGKYVLWVLREYLKGNIQRFEDMGRVKQALILFKNNLSKLSEQQKQLNKLSFGELENLVSPYQDILTQNAIKRIQKEKIWSEIDVIYEGVEGKIYVPKTKEASVFLGQGTKWCTAAVNNNMFGYYNKQGPLYVFILAEKDEQGREIKYQLHFESGQFMDAEDKRVEINKKIDLINILFENLSMEKKIKLFLDNDYFFKNFHKKNDFKEIYDELLLEKAKLSYGFNERKFNFFEYIDDKNKKNEIIKNLIKSNKIFFVKLDKKYKTREICNFAAEFRIENIKGIPEEFVDIELSKKAIEKNPKLLSNVPKKFLDIKKQKNIWNRLFSKNKDIDLCEMAVEREPEALCFVPHSSRTYELCKMAVLKNGLTIKYVPLQLVTKELCNIAVRQNGMAWFEIFEDHKYPETLKIAISSEPKVIMKISNHRITPELAEIAIRKNGLMLGYIPTQLKTYELCKIAYEQNLETLNNIPHEIRKKMGLNDVNSPKQNNRLVSYKEEKTKDLKRKSYSDSSSNYDEDEDDDDYFGHKSATKVIKICSDKIHEFTMNLLGENGLNYSFDEALDLMFDLDDNIVKTLFEDTKSNFEDLYKEKVLSRMISKIQEIQTEIRYSQ